MSHSIPIDKENYPQYIKLGLNIAYYRKRAGLTQEQLAEKLDISRSHLSALEAPNIVRTCSLELLFDLARALGTTPSKLLEFRD